MTPTKKTKNEKDRPVHVERLQRTTPIPRSLICGRWIKQDGNVYSPVTKK